MMVVHPALLYLLFLVFLVIALHLIRKRRKRVSVSSLMIWERVVLSSRKVFFTSRILRSILLLLQVLFLLFLIFALAGISVDLPGRGYREDLILLMDVSASMQADTGKGSRFEEARDLARRIIRDTSSGSGIILMAAGKTGRVVLPYTRDRKAILDSLNGLDATDEAGNIEEALESAVSMAQLSGEYRIIVLTDSQPEISRAAPEPGDVEVRYVGKPGDNLALGVFSWRRPLHRKYDLDFYLEVVNYGSSDVRAPVFVEFDDGTIKRFDGVFPAGEVTPIAFEYNGFLPERVRAWIDHDDILPGDNEGYAVVTADTSLRVLLIGPGNPYLETLLKLFPRVVLYRDTDPDRSTDGADIVIYDRMSPMFLPPGRYIFLDSLPPGFSFYPAGEFRGDPVAAGVADHPVIDGAIFSGMTVDRGTAFAGSDTPILTARGMPFLAVYEDEGIRWVRLSVDLEATALPYRPAFPIIVGGSIEWLMYGGCDAGRGIPAGQPLTGGLPLSEVEVLLPDGTLQKTETDKDGRMFVDTSTAGFYTVRNERGERSVAVQPAGSGESDLRPLPVSRTPGDRPSSGAQPRRTVRLDTLLLLLSMFILLLEFYLTSRGWKE